MGVLAGAIVAMTSADRPRKSIEMKLCVISLIYKRTVLTTRGPAA
jgi:hypothetical protein